MNAAAGRRPAGNASRGALERNSSALQPQIDSAATAICGFEALLRWTHPELGPISPMEFIPIAEETGLIVPIGEWVLLRACRQAKQWVETFDANLRVAVNLSARQFSLANLPQVVAAALKESGLPARNLELEVTESLIMQDIELSTRTLHELKAMGITLAVDDFGTGYSSLAYLKRFPLDILKIDKSFVAEITSNPDDAAICSSIIAMAHSLRLKVVAEGIETAQQLGFLAQQHCDRAQGYHFSRPVDAAAAGELMRRGMSLGAPAAHAATRARTLLLLDDEANILTSLKRLLRREGYTILIANNSTEAFELLAAHPVGVVVSDQRMPDMTGTEFLSRVKELYPDTVRMVLSGYTDLQSVIEAINEGSIYRFLTKPWDDDQLRSTLREAFLQQEMVQENVLLNQQNREHAARLQEITHNGKPARPEDDRIARDEALIGAAQRLSSMCRCPSSASTTAAWSCWPPPRWTVAWARPAAICRRTAGGAPPAFRRPLPAPLPLRSAVGTTRPAPAHDSRSGGTGGCSISCPCPAEPSPPIEAAAGVGTPRIH